MDADVRTYDENTCEEANGRRRRGTVLEEQAVFTVGIPLEEGSPLERVHRGNPGVSLKTFWGDGGSVLDAAHGGWRLGCLPPQLTCRILLIVSNLTHDITSVVNNTDQREGRRNVCPEKRSPHCQERGRTGKWHSLKE